MHLEAAAHRYDAKHKDLKWHDGAFQSWARERDDAHPFHYLWGVRLWVAREDLTPDDDFI